MNSTVILLFILVMMSFLFYNNQQENFVQVQSNRNINKNAPMIKPAQVTPGYNQTVKIYDRDDPVSNPKYSPNIIPNLLKSSSNLYLPGQSNGSFEQSDNKNKQLNEKNILSSKKNSNPKAIRPDSGQLIRPIELDSAPSLNTQVEKPYINKDYPQAYSEFLEYTGVSPQKSSNYISGIFSDQQPVNSKEPQTSQYSLNNQKIEIYNKKKQLINNLSDEDIIKKLIKKSAELSMSSIKNINSLNSLNSMKKANYAVGYLNMLKDIMSDLEISGVANINLEKFTEELEKNQKINEEKITQKCTNMSIDKKYLLEIATKL